MKVARAVGALAGLFLFVLGVWAFLGPRSFYDQLATFPPYNRHLIHDVGAFQIGLGATLLISLIKRDPLATALLGTGIGAGFHAVSHWWDKDLGGRTSDPYLLTLVGVIILAAGLLRARSRT